MVRMVRMVQMVQMMRMVTVRRAAPLRAGARALFAPCRRDAARAKGRWRGG
eukprot:gene10662-6108_t